MLSPSRFEAERGRVLDPVREYLFAEGQPVTWNGFEGIVRYHRERAYVVFNAGKEEWLQLSKLYHIAPVMARVSGGDQVM